MLEYDSSTMGGGKMMENGKTGRKGKYGADDRPVLAIEIQGRKGCR